MLAHMPTHMPANMFAHTLAYRVQYLYYIKECQIKFESDVQHIEAVVWLYSMSKLNERCLRGGSD